MNATERGEKIVQNKKKKRVVNNDTEIALTNKRLTVDVEHRKYTDWEAKQIEKFLAKRSA